VWGCAVISASDNGVGFARVRVAAALRKMEMVRSFITVLAQLIISKGSFVQSIQAYVCVEEGLLGKK